MSDKTIIQLTTLTTVAINDVVPIVDVSDTTDSLNGTTKGITQANLVADRAPLASPTFTGTVTVPTPFVLGAITVTPTGDELNFVDGVTSAIQTQLNNKQPLDTDLTQISSLVDPNADRILFWDDSAGSWAHLTVGTGLSITGTTINATASGGGYTKLTATGSINSVNSAFTFIQQPLFIVADGVWYEENNGYTWSILTATLTIPPSNSIWGFV